MKRVAARAAAAMQPHHSAPWLGLAGRCQAHAGSQLVAAAQRACLASASGQAAALIPSQRPQPSPHLWRHADGVGSGAGAPGNGDLRLGTLGVLEAAAAAVGDSSWVRGPSAQGPTVSLHQGCRQWSRSCLMHFKESAWCKLQVPCCRLQGQALACLLGVVGWGGRHGVLRLWGRGHLGHLLAGLVPAPQLDRRGCIHSISEYMCVATSSQQLGANKQTEPCV